MKETKGITIVSLVVTIIILLILASVTINFILGNKGLFKRTHTAIEKYKQSYENEKNELNELV